MKYLSLFLIGAVAGTILDGLQTYGGQAYYPHPFLFQTAWWVPFLFGGGVLLIGWIHSKIDPNRSLLGRKFVISTLFLVLACLITAFLPVSSGTKALFLLALYLLSWNFCGRSFLNFALALSTALVGCLLEGMLGKWGLYYYRNPDLAGLPYWLFSLYLHLSAAGGYLGRLFRL